MTQPFLVRSWSKTALRKPWWSRRACFTGPHGHLKKRHGCEQNTWELPNKHGTKTHAQEKYVYNWQKERHVAFSIQNVVQCWGIKEKSWFTNIYRGLTCINGAFRWFDNPTCGRWLNTKNWLHNHVHPHCFVLEIRHVRWWFDIRWICSRFYKWYSCHNFPSSIWCEI